MKSEELTDIVLKHIQGINYLTKNNILFPTTSGLDHSLKKLKEEINKQKTTLKDKFIGKQRGKALEKYLDKMNPKEEDNLSLLQTAKEYLNLFQNYYNGFISQEKFIPIMKNILVEVYNTNLNKAYSTKIKSRKTLGRIRNGCLLATIGSGYAFFAWPSIPLIALTLGLGVGTGIFQGAVTNNKTILKEGQNLIEEDNKIRDKIKETKIEEFEKVLLDRKEEIKNLIKYV